MSVHPYLVVLTRGGESKESSTPRLSPNFSLIRAETSSPRGSLASKVSPEVLFVFLDNNHERRRKSNKKLVPL